MKRKKIDRETDLFLEFGEPDLNDFSFFERLVDQNYDLKIEDFDFVRMNVNPNRPGFKRNKLELFPVEVAEFTADLIAGFDPAKILIPYTTSGLLPLQISRRTKAKNIDAISPLNETQDLITWLDGRAINLQIANDPDEALKRLGKYDAIVAYLTDSLAYFFSDEYEEPDPRESLIVRSCLHLHPDGVAAFVVPSGLFSFGRHSGLFEAIVDLGWNLDAAIELPLVARHSKPRSTHLIIIKKNIVDTIFTARLPEHKRGRKQLIWNYRNRKPSSVSPQLGYIAARNTFYGFSPTEQAIQVVRIAERAELDAIPFENVFWDNEVGDADAKRFPVIPQNNLEIIYLPKSVKEKAVSFQELRLDEIKKYIRLLVNTEVANAEYLVRWLNSRHGHAWRGSLASSSFLRGDFETIARRNLRSSSLFLPCKSIQDDLVRSCNQIENEKARLTELHDKLWERPNQVADLSKEVTLVDREQQFEQWIDSLPFPLASILWICHAESGSPQEQFRPKLHFFEALSAFLAVLHMSAFSSDHSLWKEVSAKIDSKLKANNLSLERATFATWDVINQSLMKKLRIMLIDDDSRKFCFGLYRTTDRQLLSALCVKDLLSLTQKAIALRNRAAHGGTMSETDAIEVNDALQQLILDVRNVFGFLWEDYQLLLPGPNEYDSGVYNTQVQVLQGTRQPFPWSTVDVLGPMQKGSLHFKSIDGQQTLELLPLVKVMESPAKEQNACYFYNRKESGGISFQSYHFRAEANITQQFQDTEKAISRLFDSEISFPD